MSMEQLLRQYRADILRLAAKHGAHDVRVFGSVVRGEDTPDSDVDFLVTMEPERSLFDMGGLLTDLEDLLGRRVDVVTQDGLHSYIRDRVLNEAVPV
jgi:predicted nucleotidyltransferase